jgi:CRISPR system Cascade subunit CasD
MSSTNNTLFLRLAGPMQSWGTSSRFQLRRTDAYPSKSGVLGLLLCAMGIPREDSPEALKPLTPLLMGVREDRVGTLDWDYHTAGAKIGMRKAEGGIKREGNKKGRPVETLLSRRQYLYDASFLVALQGDTDTIGACARALDHPVWPVFLGRKCCVPAEPILAGMGAFHSLTDALASVPWQPRIEAIDRYDRNTTRTLDTFLEHPAGSPPLDGARLVYDVPRAFGHYNDGARWVVAGQVTVVVEKPMQAKDGNRRARHDPYGLGWDEVRLLRLKIDNQLCVFCKSPAVDVHHLDYEDVRPETLRSLCKICHDACTMLEYGQDMRTLRIDPADPEQRPMILRQIERLLVERRLGRRRELLETARAVGAAFFDEVFDSWSREAR